MQMQQLGPLMSSHDNGKSHDFSAKQSIIADHFTFRNIPQRLQVVGVNLLIRSLLDQPHHVSQLVATSIPLLYKSLLHLKRTVETIDLPRRQQKEKREQNFNGRWMEDEMRESVPSGFCCFRHTTYYIGKS